MRKLIACAVCVSVVGILGSAGNILASEVTGTINTGIASGVTGIVITAPTASPAAGSYSSAQSVTLSASGSSSIHYTTDGSTPTCSTGSTYSSAISLSSSATVKAIACYPNSNSSDVASFGYTINLIVSGGGGGGGGGGYYSTPETATATTTPAVSATTTVVSAAAAATLREQQVQLLNLLITQLQLLFEQARNSGVELSASTEQAIASLTAPGTTLPVVSGYQFTRDLDTGSEGEDVRQLQIFLNDNGFTVSASGPGSLGNETSLFGGGTRAALAKYQKSVGISPAVGRLGPATRAYVNAHRGAAPAPAETPTTSGYQFTRDLDTGSEGEEIGRAHV